MGSSVMVKGKGEDRRLGKRLSWAARDSSGQVLKPRVTVYGCPTKAYVIFQHTLYVGNITRKFGSNGIWRFDSWGWLIYIIYWFIAEKKDTSCFTCSLSTHDAPTRCQGTTRPNTLMQHECRCHIFRLPGSIIMHTWTSILYQKIFHGWLIQLMSESNYLWPEPISTVDFDLYKTIPTSHQCSGGRKKGVCLLVVTPTGECQGFDQKKNLKRRLKE